MTGIRNSATFVSTAASAVLVVATLVAAPAFADGHGEHRGETLLRAALVGSNPAPASPVIAMVDPGGAPWVNGPSTVRVREDGRIQVMIRGLVIPGRGNPVLSAVATLVCDDKIAGRTMPFALTDTGDGGTRDHVVVPEDCDDPTVLIQPAALLSRYIASTTGEHDD